MIPVNDIEDDGYDFEEEIETSHTYAICNDRIIGYVDGIEAVQQAVYLIINTERFRYLIYSWDYAIELEDLFGEPIGFIKSEMKRRIEEALTHDDRIESVENFIFDIKERNTLRVKFTVNSIYGSFEIEKEVKI